ncbi:imidazole glycerol phosphate synthase subunit HisF [Candidatus Berkiella aquae]|uniref:imidazole glycerol-phosphate synthase n=1 Tax=Candidatus Berkiella aquae TaxID=295108 RepID=A0A0Q9YWJ3_9GAMM|nr:imidazole glycerol phosphate synthase subunit HisF [Candidatus Berkiella aquae]MCS5710410.1 imidazole glycerol phosphate synthase subunit HisF [Candidatus Berkiella aquae]
MLTKRIIPCLDVRNNAVVKGVQFRNHQIVGDILELASYYAAQGADELVFYDITASSDQRSVDKTWISRIAQNIDIPFCVAGGITSVKQAETILNAGADKISINSPALTNPALINELVNVFGSQCIVIGVDSIKTDAGYFACQYTGDANKTRMTTKSTLEWVKEVQSRGAGEIVLNCMDQDGVRQGYAIAHLKQIRAITDVPLIASGGAGVLSDFAQVFAQANVDGALAASVFHKKLIEIPELKQYLKMNSVRVRQ